MAKNIEHLQHIKSSVVEGNGKPKLPTSNVLVDGEIAINYAKGVETISLKNTSGDIVTFSSDDYYTEQKLGSGFTGENSGITVTDYIDKIYDATLGLDNVLEFDPSTSYNIGDYCWYENKLYRFTQDHIGAWNINDVIETTVFTELDHYSKVEYEEVFIQLKTEEEEPLANVTVRIDVEGETADRILTTNADGQCTTTITKGLEYVVKCDDVENYYPVTPQKKRASLSARYISFVYIEEISVNYETVFLQIYYAKGWSTNPTTKGEYVTFTYDEEAHNIPLTDTATVTTTIPLGKTYAISFLEVNGYTAPSSMSFTAEIKGVRQLKATYIAPWVGAVWLMKDNTTKELNSVVSDDRDNIFGLIVQTSELMANNARFVMPFTYLVSQNLGTGQWLSSNTNVPTMPQCSNETLALGDFNGEMNCQKIIDFASANNLSSSMATVCRNKVGGAPEFDVTKTYEAGDYVITTNDENLHCFKQHHDPGEIQEGETTVSKGWLMPNGAPKSCFNPAYAQLKAYHLLYSSVNNVTTSTFNLNIFNCGSKNVWSSTQYNANYGVLLNNGGFNYYDKDNVLQVLPVLAY